MLLQHILSLFYGIGMVRGLADDTHSLQSNRSEMNFTPTPTLSTMTTTATTTTTTNPVELITEISNSANNSIASQTTSTATTSTATVTASVNHLLTLANSQTNRSSSMFIDVKHKGKFFNKNPYNKKRKTVDVLSIPIEENTDIEWQCPNITGTRSLECGCDLPQTLRCNGDLHGLNLLAERLRNSPYSIALLDISLRNVSYLSDARIFNDIYLRCLIISSGEIKRVHKSAFQGIKGPLLALGLPGNALLSIPWNAISFMVDLERLDLSNNRIKALSATDIANLRNLEYLDLSHNQISSISQRTFAMLYKLEILKLAGNHLGNFPSSLKALNLCYSLRDLDLSGNNLNGPLTPTTLPELKRLTNLNLNLNLINSIRNKAFVAYTELRTLLLRHNQIDVLQDHAFFGLGTLETLDLSYNGIVAISSASLQHLTRLRILDLTHNFLRALTADLINPLPSLNVLRLAGNDISMVALHALNGAHELSSLSMEENPLSCDCTIREFAQWLHAVQLPMSDAITITCVTPPKLEGAPLIQVPMEMLNCDMDNTDKDNMNIIDHLDAITRQNHSAHIRDLSEEIILYDLHFSNDYGLILTWILNLSKNDYMCDAIFVYKEENINEILIDNSPIHCESKMINGKNTVSVIVPDSSSLSVGNSYRFCLVMVQEHSQQQQQQQQQQETDLTVGCSNITKLQLSNRAPLAAKVRQVKRRPYADLKSFERSINDDHNHHLLNDDDHDDLEDNIKEFPMKSRQMNTLATHYKEIDTNSNSNSNLNRLPAAKKHLIYEDVSDSLQKSFLPGLALGILLTSIMVLIWAATRLRYHHTTAASNPSSNTSTATTICYSANEHLDPNLTELTENNARYLKLQATTSL